MFIIPLGDKLAEDGRTVAGPDGSEVKIHFAGVTKDTGRSVARGSEIVTRRTSALLRAVRAVEQAKAVAA